MQRTPRQPMLCAVLRGGLLCGMALLGLAAAPGCNIVAPAAYIIGGTGKIPAQHKLDSRRPTVIFIDDRANVLPRRSLRVLMGQEADSTLIEKRVIAAPNMIASSSTMRAAADERYGTPIPIGEIAQQVGAEVIIYVQIERWALTRDGSSFSPVALVRVKVLDVAAEQRLWPAAGEGQALIVELPVRSREIPQSRADRNAAEDMLANAVGVRIARLFFEHERDALSSRMGD
jgi:hypothetical protein